MSADKIERAAFGYFLAFCTFALLVLLGCGLHKPYGSPCPPAPAQSDAVAARLLRGARLAAKENGAWYCPPTMDTVIVENEAREVSIYCAPKTKNEKQGIGQ